MNMDFGVNKTLSEGILRLQEPAFYNLETKKN